MKPTLKFLVYMKTMCSGKHYPTNTTLNLKHGGNRLILQTLFVSKAWETDRKINQAKHRKIMEENLSEAFQKVLFLRN